ncbi:MAG TPA: aldo/keto reductase [Polyangia bacterium]|jgi:predicted aldo/keto reductase-like oxidoreductase|nr:aldo/keto reductase [Polyangia bacterium]
MSKRHGRRRFLALGSGLAAGAALGKLDRGAAFAGPDDVPKKPQPGAPRPEDFKLPAGAKMPMRPLGRTGVEVSILGLGGFHLGLPKDEKVATRIIHTAIDHGVNFMDNCWDYNDGESQRRMGRALESGFRRRVFLMTKIDGRTRKAAAEQIDQCLAALRTDVIDLVQIHEVIRESDGGRVFAPGGAIEALVAARKAGKIRFIGFTGHKSPDIHLGMLKTATIHEFHFDTVQMPVNVMDAHHDSFGKRVIPVAVEKGVGVIGMKPFGSGLFFRSAPLASRAVTPADCLHYAMSQPTSVVVTGCDTEGILMQALDAALRFRPLTDEQTRSLLARTAPEGAAGAWERYKVADTFDGTAKHPWWLETAKL